MIVDDYIKWANKEIDKNESYIQAADGLPGLYYDAKEVKGYEKNIECYKQLVKYLENYKKLKQESCEDCISRQAVDGLSKELVHTTRDKADFLCNFWEGLQKLPPVTPKEKTGWIPVTERLPEEGKQVLCCNKQGSVFTSAVTYRNSSMVAFGQHCDVIAWMPLPEPYKVEGEDKTGDTDGRNG